MLHKDAVRRLSFGHCPLLACAILLAGPASLSFSREADESQYRSSLNSALDGLIAKCSKLPRRPVIFSAKVPAMRPSKIWTKSG